MRPRVYPQIQAVRIPSRCRRIGRPVGGVRARGPNAHVPAVGMGDEVGPDQMRQRTGLKIFKHHVGVNIGVGVDPRMRIPLVPKVRLVAKAVLVARCGGRRNDWVLVVIVVTRNACISAGPLVKRPANSRVLKFVWAAAGKTQWQATGRATGVFHGVFMLQALPGRPSSWRRFQSSVGEYSDRRDDAGDQFRWRHIESRIPRATRRVRHADISARPDLGPWPLAVGR